MRLTRVFITGLAIFTSVRASAQTNFAQLASDGAWTWFNDPRAIFHNGKLYFGFVRSADSKSVLDVFDLSTGQNSDLWVSAFTQLDDHNNPGLLSKQDGKLLAVYSRHLSDQYFAYRLSSSTNPVSSADWGAEQHIANSGAAMTYANPFQLSSESGKIYNFCRNTNYNPTVYTSVDSGTNWSAPQILIKAGTGSTRPYVKYSCDYTNRIEFLYTDGHPREVISNSLYHLYYQTNTFSKTDGTFVKNYSGLPILHDSGERGSVIYQYSTAAQSDPNQWIPRGRSWCWEIASQTNGQPACVFSVMVSNVMGTTQGTDDRIYYYYARWTGAAWQKRFIAQAGKPLYAAENDYAGGICLDPTDVNTIYISSDALNPFDLTQTTNVPLRAGNRYEIWRGNTTDGGLTFAWSQITSNSSLDNIRPYIPRRNGGEQCLLWLRGTYASYTSYALSIVGLFTTAVPQTNAASGTWLSDSDGVWSDSTKWQSSIIAFGAGNTADFSTVDITSNRTVTLDTARTIGTLRFADTSSNQTWTLTGNTLTLNTGSMVVTNSAATIQAPLAGTNGITKSLAGTLILSGSSTITGPLNLDRGLDGNNDDGATRIASPNAATSFSSINIRNTSVSTAGGATLQLDGSAGNVVLTQTNSVTCRNNTTRPTFQNIAGTNTIAGPTLIQVGGTNVQYQSDAGSRLIVASNVVYVGTLTAARIINFVGAGETVVTGNIQGGTNGVTPIGVAKSGSGTLTLSGANTYSNGTTLLAGTLLYNGTVRNGAITVSGGTLGGTGTLSVPVTVQSGATFSPGNPVGTLTISNNLIVNAGATLAYALGTNSDRATVIGNLTVAGTLNVTDAGGFGPGDYTLLTYTGTLSNAGLTNSALPSGLTGSIVTNGLSLVLHVNSPPLSPFATWQLQYFGSTNCATCDGVADFDGDGQSNTNEFLAGTNPTNSASAFQITGILPAGSDVVVTWRGKSGSTGALQSVDNSYSTNFNDISGGIVVPGAGVTNYADAGAITNLGTRFYRVRLVP